MRWQDCAEPVVQLNLHGALKPTASAQLEGLQVHESKFHTARLRTMDS